jgi:FkbM family methyltransferase
MSSSNSFLLKLSRKNFFLKKIYLYYNLYIRNLKFYYEGSQFGEQNIISKYFKKDYIGTYLDLGCFHPTRQNNTFRMYRKGWSGINIDLNKLSIDLFNVMRPRDINVHAAISNKRNIKKLYYVGDLAKENTLEKNHTKFLVKHFSIKKNNIIEKKIQTQKLETILKKHKFYKIDFMNIDIEGHEYNVIKTINFDKFKIDVICIEVLNHNKASLLKNKKVIKFLKKNRYVLKEKNKVNFIFKKK